MPKICRKSATSLLFGGLLLVSSSFGIAQIYKYEDEQGNVVFSDRKPTAGDRTKGVEEVTLKATNTTTATPPRAPSDTPATPTEEAAVSYSTVITQPASGSTIAMGPGNFSVTAQVTPPLQAGEKLRLSLDGNAVVIPQKSGSWALTNVFRGAHTLVVERLNQDLGSLHQSAPVMVYVLRPSVRR